MRLLIETTAVRLLSWGYCHKAAALRLLWRDYCGEANIVRLPCPGCCCEANLHDVRNYKTIPAKKLNKFFYIFQTVANTKLGVYAPVYISPYSVAVYVPVYISPHSSKSLLSISPLESNLHTIKHRPYFSPPYSFLPLQFPSCLKYHRPDCLKEFISRSFGNWRRAYLNDMNLTLRSVILLVLTYLLTYLLTPWSTVLLEKLTGFQLVK